MQIDSDQRHFQMLHHTKTQPEVEYNALLSLIVSRTATSAAIKVEINFT